MAAPPDVADGLKGDTGSASNLPIREGRNAGNVGIE